MTSPENLRRDAERFRSKAVNLYDANSSSNNLLLQLSPAIQAVATLALVTQNAAAAAEEESRQYIVRDELPPMPLMDPYGHVQTERPQGLKLEDPRVEALSSALNEVKRQRSYLIAHLLAEGYPSTRIRQIQVGYEATPPKAPSV